MNVVQYSEMANLAESAYYHIHTYRQNMHPLGLEVWF